MVHLIYLNKHEVAYEKVIRMKKRKQVLEQNVDKALRYRGLGWVVDEIT
jgi:hypothetical protein